jgi:hypothetical protein
VFRLTKCAHNRGLQFTINYFKSSCSVVQIMRIDHLEDCVSCDTPHQHVDASPAGAEISSRKHRLSLCCLQIPGVPVYCTNPSIYRDPRAGAPSRAMPPVLGPCGHNRGWYCHKASRRGGHHVHLWNFHPLPHGQTGSCSFHYR